MQDAALAQLHSQLSSASDARGAHGGLGFAKQPKASSKKEEGTEATRTLLGEGGGGKKGTSREFHTTTAGAVAAGHWDPFARPVVFKMKEVNRRVGGLYSMFVRGGQVGSVLDETPDGAPVAAPAQAPAATSTTAKAAGDAFNWKKAIKQQLRAAEGKKLRLKRLRKAVLAEHAKTGGNARGDEAKKLFRKKLKKTDGVVLDGKMVRLDKAGS